MTKLSAAAGQSILRISTRGQGRLSKPRESLSDSHITIIVTISIISIITAIIIF